MNIQGIGQSCSCYQPMQMRGAGSMSGGFNPPDIEASNILDREDANLDGVITADESLLSEDMFSNADSDEDGQLTTGELEEMLLANGPPMNRMPGMGGEPPPKGSGVDRILAQEDQDGDGTISWEESSLSDEKFSIIDENQDGIITVEEIEKSKGNKPQQMDGGMPGSDPSMTLDQQTALDAYNTAMQSIINIYSGNQDSSQWGNLLAITA